MNNGIGQVIRWSDLDLFMKFMQKSRMNLINRAD